MTKYRRQTALTARSATDHQFFIDACKATFRETVEGADLPFQIELASTGEVVEVLDGQTAVDALKEIGVLIPTPCVDRTCGACLTRVLDGTPVHRDGLLTGAERARAGLFIPCCSRGFMRLVIDI